MVSQTIQGSYPKSIILPCKEVRLMFPTYACNAISELKSVQPHSFLDEYVTKMMNDRHGCLMTLETLVYARAVNEALGCSVLMKMKHRNKGRVVENIIDTHSLFIENSIADRLKSFGDYFLTNSGFMRFNHLYQELLYLELMFDDDVMISNYN